MGDYHVRFCEKFGVKLPLLTRRRDVTCNAQNTNLNINMTDFF